MIPMPALQIRGRIEVRRMTKRPDVLGRAMAANPRVRAGILSLAEEVAREARSGFANAPNPRGRVISRRYRGIYWSSAPSAVAAQVSVKDTGRTFPLRARSVSRARVTQVALVIADHPYSYAYEFGGLGIQSSAPLRRATRLVASRHAGSVHLRRTRRTSGVVV